MVATILATWLLTYAAGGSRTVFPHLFYVPVVLSAIRFGARGGVAAAVLAGLMSGPFLPADTMTGQSQPLASWLFRLAMFTGMALLLAWMTRHSSRSVVTVMNDRRCTSRLRTALERGEITVHYQPILSLPSGQVLGFEALARWEHPRQGLLSPSEFIPAAERTGAITELDRHVMATATRQLAEWCRTDASLWVAVNVSASRFAEDGLVEDVSGVLEDAGLSPGQLHVEITETAIIRDVPAAATQISALRKMGVKVVVDDFGAGQTSLSYLHQFGIDVIKIDRSFVTKSTTDEGAARLVSGVIRLFAAIGTEVVGEGISTAEEYVQMQSLGCEVGQGYYLGMPTPASDVPALLERAASRGTRRGLDLS